MSRLINSQTSGLVKGGGFNPIAIFSIIESIIPSIENFLIEVQKTRRMSDQFDYEIRKGHQIVKELKLNLNADLNNKRLILQNRDSQRRSLLLTIEKLSSYSKTLIKQFTILANNPEIDIKRTEPILKIIDKVYERISDLSISIIDIYNADTNKKYMEDKCYQ